MRGVLTLCILDEDPFRVELPAFLLQGEWVERFRASRRKQREAVLTPNADFDEAALEGHGFIDPCTVVGPACLQAKEWVRDAKRNKLFRPKYYWPSKRLQEFCEPGWHPRAKRLKGTGMEDYKSVWL